MRTVNAYAATSPTDLLGPITIERRGLGAYDVLIEIAYCGICHTDIHWVRGDWGVKDYPVVPGHEMTGTVTEIGGAVTRHAVGDRVGVGCMVNSCRECANCRKGYEQYCLNGNILTYGSIDRDGILAIVGATPEYSLHRSSLVRNQRAFSGSLIGGLPVTQEMLDFCAAHGVGAEIETVGAKQINEAYERVLASDVRYRFVIDNATFS